MLCKRQTQSFLFLLTIQWIIGARSTNTTVSNVTSSQNATTLLPTAHNTTVPGNITTPHPPSLNTTLLQHVTGTFHNVTPTTLHLPSNVTTINTTVGPTAHVINTTASRVVPTARPINVTHVTHNVTMRHNVTVGRDNVTSRAVNQTRVMPTARRDNFTVVPTPGMTRVNTTIQPHNATQPPFSPTMAVNMTAGPDRNQTRIVPTNSWHLVTMAPNRTSLPPHANVTAAVTQPPTTSYNTKPATTIGSFPVCNATCHRYASCVAGGSGKSCVCNAGYSGDGTTCTLASKKVNMEMRMTSIPFTEDLKDKNSEAFRSLSFKVSKQIFVYLKTTSLGSSLLSVTILSFRQGSVVANYNANFKSNVTVSDSGVSSALQQAISKDPNNTLGIDVTSLCTKTNEDAACGETAGIDQNLLIGLAVGVPIVAIIMLTILGCVIKRALDRKKGEGQSEGKKNDNKGENEENNKKNKKTVSEDGKNPTKERNGRPQKNGPSASYGKKQDSFDPQRNYKRMTFQPAIKSGPADKYEHDLGGIYFPRRYRVPQEPKPSFHYVEGHVQGRPVTVVVPI